MSRIDARTFRDCVPCDGTGHVEQSTGAPYDTATVDCPDCHGTGEQRCEECHRAASTFAAARFLIL